MSSRVVKRGRPVHHGVADDRAPQVSARSLFGPLGLLIAGLVLVGGGIAALRTAGQTSDPVAAGGKPAVFIGRADRACSSSQRYGPTRCTDMWVGDVQVDGRTVARGVPWAGSLASGQPTGPRATGSSQLRGVPAIWREGFTYAYPPGYTDDAVITAGDSVGLATAPFAAGGLMLIGAIAWRTSVVRR